MTEAPTREELRDLFEQALSSVDEVCSQLTPEEWDRPTDCRGWSVKDNLSHIASYEAVAVGRPAAPGDVPVSHYDHIKPGNLFAEPNEREVETRRGTAPRDVLEEFREVTLERLKHLGSLDDDAWERDVSTFPFGTVPTKDSLSTRVLDVFFHEQDIRRATGRPGHLDGVVARHAVRRLLGAMPRIVARNAGAPDGTTAVFEVGPPGRTVSVEVAGGRGAEVPTAPAAPDVRLRMDAETFLRLVGGRWTAAAARAEGRLDVEGGEDLAGRILDNFVVIP